MGRPARVCGLFIPDQDIPADHRGRHTCATCHLVGEPGDPHHTLPEQTERDVRLLQAGQDGGDG